MPGWIGPWELVIIIVVLLIIFGPKRLPQAGRSLGKSMREFKHAVTGKDEQREDDEDGPAELTVAHEEEPVSTKPRERDTVG